MSCWRSKITHLGNSHSPSFLLQFHTEVAQSVGISYRHVFRILGELCREGILERTKSGFRIRDRERLRQRSCEAE